MKIVNDFLTVDGKISSSKIKACPEHLAQEICCLTTNADESAGLVERLYWIKNSLSDYPKACLTCGGPVKSFYSFSKGYLADYCSTKCARQSPIADKKKKDTIVRRYGAKSIWDVESIRIKRENTCLQRYGENSPMSIARQSFLESKHVLHVSAAPGILEKRKQTIHQREIEKLKGALPNFAIDSVSYKGANFRVRFECRRCGTKSENKPNKISCPACDKTDGRSSLEDAIIEDIKQAAVGINIVVNKKYPELNIFPDLFFPDFNLVVELDSNYWHAEGRGGDKLKSAKRKKLLSDVGVNSMFFFEDEVLNKRDIVVSMILSRLNVFSKKIRASKCEVRPVSSVDAAKFLNENHLQGSVKSSTKIGLYFNGDLVALATFGRPRFNNKANHELLRLCFKKNTKVFGGASKLISTFRQANHGSILSYADKRYSNAGVYSAIGFSFISDNAPSYFYVDRRDYLTRMSRFKFQKHKLIEMGGDALLTEWENAQLMNLDRIFDCGTSTWILK